MSIAAVAFDLHGTLILPTPSVGEIYAACAASVGINVAPQIIEPAFFEAFSTTRERWPTPYGCDAGDAAGFWHTVITDTFARCGHDPLPNTLAPLLFDTFGRGDHWRVLPGGREALTECRERNLPIILCSNFDHRARRIITDLGLGPFAAIAISAELGAAKPDPIMHLAPCQELGLAPADLLHIGDHPREDGGLCEASGAAYLAVPRDGSGIDLTALRSALSAAD